MQRASVHRVSREACESLALLLVGFQRFTRLHKTPQTYLEGTLPELPGWLRRPVGAPRDPFPHVPGVLSCLVFVSGDHCRLRAEHSVSSEGRESAYCCSSSERHFISRKLHRISQQRVGSRHTHSRTHAGLSTKTRVCTPPAWTLIRLPNHGTHIHHDLSYIWPVYALSLIHI